MRCPFLREAQVKSCRATAYRKMIVRLAGQPESERCSTGDYVRCPAAQQHLDGQQSSDHCPFLHEALVQYCTAAAVTKYIPYTESVLSQCGTESHRYCDLYLGLAQPQECGADADGNGARQCVNGIQVPAHLYYSPNHLWMEVGSDGVCHIGVDAFLSTVLGPADQLTFITTRGTQRPVVSFTVGGTDVQFTFPLPVTITKANTYLRTNPEKITVDPYTFGWLFEATIDRTVPLSEQTKGLITGDAVMPWMRSEVDRMNDFVHAMISAPGVNGEVMMADGGSFTFGFARRLRHDDLLRLHNSFFTTQTFVQP